MQSYDIQNRACRDLSRFVAIGRNLSQLVAIRHRLPHSPFLSIPIYIIGARRNPPIGPVASKVHSVAEQSTSTEGEKPKNVKIFYFSKIHPIRKITMLRRVTLVILSP